MAEADLKKAILARIQQEKETILNQARKDAEEIIRQAKDEASSFKEKYLLDLKKRCLLEKAKELSAIYLEIKRQLLELKEKKISQVLSLVKKNFRAIQNDKTRYKSIFRQLLQESLGAIDKRANLKLRVNPSEREMALEIIKEQKIDAKLEVKESVDTGLVISDLEENIIVLNTFTSRLEKLIPQLRQEVGKILFGELLNV